MSTLSDNKRIAKNTVMLYIRMFFTMAVSLYTSRVILRTLGVTDYGILNVVGGFVSMLSFLNASMASATQRYLNVDIAQGNKENLRTTFRTAVQIHLLIAIIVFVFAETVGLWFLLNKMVIPEERMTAAFWVFQLSVVSTMMGIICVPYNADIIAHERMDAFAYISILDAILKLIIVYLIVISPFDRLISYSFLFLCVGLLDSFIYNMYCKRHFKEVNFSLKVDKFLFKEMLSFSGWSMWGHLAGVLFTEGINVTLNLFFGPAVNAARGIAVQVQGVVSGFAGNVQAAVYPQITKSYAQGNLHRMHNLMISSSKFCFFLLYLIVLPIFFEIDVILKVWLGIVPKHTVCFVRLILFIMLTDTLATPYVIANQATGKVKKYQIVCGGMMLLIVPLAYISLKLGAPPESVFIVHGTIAVLTQFARVFMMRNLIDFSVSSYCHKVLMPVIIVAFTSFVLPCISYLLITNIIVRFFVTCIVSVISVAVCAYYLGTNYSEKELLLETKNKLINRLIKR